jgi:hypothetical protein
MKAKSLSESKSEGQIDYSTAAGAQLLADMVRAHWAAQGIPVRVEIDQVRHPRSLREPNGTDRIVYVVRSDMRNGRPAAANLRGNL